MDCWQEILVGIILWELLKKAVSSIFKEKNYILMAQENYKNNLVDTAWRCECGAMNAGYKNTCGKCNKEKL
mgnify:CR=1 FL=1